MNNRLWIECMFGIISWCQLSISSCVSYCVGCELSLRHLRWTLPELNLPEHRLYQCCLNVQYCDRNVSIVTQLSSKLSTFGQFICIWKTLPTHWRQDTNHSPKHVSVGLRIASIPGIRWAKKFVKPFVSAPKRLTLLWFKDNKYWVPS